MDEILKISLYTIVPVAIVIISCSMVLIKSSKPNAEEEHYSPKSNKPLILFSNVSSSLGVAAFWGLFVTSFKGWGIPSFLSIFFGTIVAFTFIAMRVKVGSNNSSLLSVLRTNQKSEHLIKIYFIIVLLFLIMEIAYLNVMISNLFEISNIPKQLSLICSFSIFSFAIFYTYIGGMKAVLRTDFILISLLLLFLMTFLVGDNGRVDLLFWDELKEYSYTSLSKVEIINFISAGINVAGLFIIMPDFWHRNLVVLRSKSIKKRQIIIALSCLCVLTLLPLIYEIGVVSRSINDMQFLDNNEIHKAFTFSPREMLLWTGELNVILIIGIMTFIMALSLTTLDSLMIAIAGATYQEKKLIYKRKNSNASYRETMALIFFFFFLSFLLSALIEQNSILKLVLFLGLLQVMFISCLLVSKKANFQTSKIITYVYLSFFIGFVLCAIDTLGGFNIWWTNFSIASPLISFIIVKIISKREITKHVQNK